MADKNKMPPDNRNMLRLHAEKASTNYANFTVITSTPEEVILNFSLNFNPPQPGQTAEVEVSSRVIMTYPSAKRLVLALGSVIQNFEAANGVINVAPQAPRPPEPPNPRFN